jgi:hypothetical protein
MSVLTAVAVVVLTKKNGSSSVVVVTTRAVPVVVVLPVCVTVAYWVLVLCVRRKLKAWKKVDLHSSRCHSYS